jgi:phage anti-repressor protein
MDVAVPVIGSTMSEAGRIALGFLGDPLRRDIGVLLASDKAELGGAEIQGRVELPDGSGIDVILRRVGGEERAVVSARLFWLLTQSKAPFPAWWALTRDLNRYVSGVDFVVASVDGEVSDPVDLDYWLRLPAVARAVESALPWHRKKLVTQLTMIEEDCSRASAARDLAREAADAGGASDGQADTAPVHAGTDEPIASGANGLDPTEAAGNDEPWAEAFDFGRLVPVVEREVGGVVQPTVSARDVHTFLAPGRDFSTWFEDRLSDCSLSPSSDYLGISPAQGGITRRGRKRIDYALVVAAAKKIAMVAPGSRGNAVREYFIECERRLLAGEPPIPGSVPQEVVGRVAPLPADLPPVAAPRSFQLSMPDDLVPLTIQEFLRVVTFEDNLLGADAAEAHARTLARTLMRDGRGALATRHPADWNVLVFARVVLDEWWADHRLEILAMPAI